MDANRTTAPAPSSPLGRIVPLVAAGVGHAGMAGVLLLVAPAASLSLAQAAGVAAMAAAVGVMLALATRTYAEGSACAGAASAGGWLMALLAAIALGVTGPSRGRMLLTAMLTAAACGPFLAAWAREGGAGSADVLALSALAGWPVLLALTLGAPAGPIGRLAASVALVVGCAALMALQRRRLRGRRTPAPVGLAEPIHPAVSGYRLEHHVLLMLFAGVQALLLAELLGAGWLGVEIRRQGEATQADIHWLIVAIAGVVWLLLWVATRPTRLRALRRAWPVEAYAPPDLGSVPAYASGPATPGVYVAAEVDPASAQPPDLAAPNDADEDDPAPPSFLPPGLWPASPSAEPARAYVRPAAARRMGWVLVAAAAQFVLCIEVGVFAQRLYSHIPGLTETMLLATAVMTLLIAISASVAPLLGGARFGALSVLYSLALMTALSAALLRLWLRQMAF